MTKKLSNQFDFSEDFSFLMSVRFWKLVLAAITFALFQEGVISEALFSAVEMILGGSILIRTIDRHGEKEGSKDTA